MTWSPANWTTQPKGEPHASFMKRAGPRLIGDARDFEVGAAKPGEELLQDFCIKELSRASPAYLRTDMGDEHYVAYVRWRFRNFCLDCVRTAMRRRRKELPLEIEPAVEDDAHLAEECRRILEAISEEERRLLELRYLQALTLEELMKRLRISRPTLSKRISHATEKLRRVMRQRAG